MLDPVTFNQIMLKQLAAYFKANITEEQINIWYLKIKHLEQDVFEQTVDQFTVNERPIPSNFPSIKSFLEASAGVRERKIFNQKRIDDAQDKNFFSKKNKNISSEYVKEISKLFYGLMGGSLKFYDVVDAMFEMAQRYPRAAIGLRANALKIMMNNGIPLNKDQEWELSDYLKNERSKEFQSGIVRLS